VLLNQCDQTGPVWQIDAHAKRTFDTITLHPLKNVGHLNRKVWEVDVAM
jgi:hypothetical protein